MKIYSTGAKQFYFEY